MIPIAGAVPISVDQEISSVAVNGSSGGRDQGYALNMYGAGYEIFQAGGEMDQGNSQKMRRAGVPGRHRVPVAERTSGDRFSVDGLLPPWLGSSDYHVFEIRGMGNSKCSWLSRFVVRIQRPVESYKTDLKNRKANVFLQEFGALKCELKRTLGS